MLFHPISVPNTSQNSKRIRRINELISRTLCTSLYPENWGWGGGGRRGVIYSEVLLCKIIRVPNIFNYSVPQILYSLARKNNLLYLENVVAKRNIFKRIREKLWGLGLCCPWLLGVCLSQTSRTWRTSISTHWVSILQLGECTSRATRGKTAFPRSPHCKRSLQRKAPSTNHRVWPKHWPSEVTRKEFCLSPNLLRHLVKTRPRLVSPLGFDLNEVVWFV